jgi:UDP-N-acetyl-D-glucosamine dehydrogenase
MSARDQLRRAIAGRTARVGAAGATSSNCLSALAGVGYPTAASDLPGTADVVLLGVPAALAEASTAPDATTLAVAARAVALSLRPGQLIVLSGPVPPGTTRGGVLPPLAASGQVPGRDFFLAFSAECGRTGARPVRIVGGFDPDSLELAAALFDPVGPVHRVSSPEAAELCGLAGIAAHAIQAAVGNELRQICDRVGADVWEVLAAGASVGLTIAEPGHGFGDPRPSLLARGVRRYGTSARLAELAVEVNAAVPAFVAAKVADALNDAGKPLKGSRVSILGVVEEETDTNQPRTGLGLELIGRLLDKGAVVTYHDPSVPLLPLTRGGAHLEPVASRPLTSEYLAAQDCVLTAFVRTALDYEFVVRHSRLVVDPSNATKGMTAGRERIRRV